MVISTATAAICSRVASNMFETEAAARAASTLAPSQILRLRADLTTGAKGSSSSSIPAILIIECSASSRIISTTSSMVIRPTRCWFSSTTGAETQLRRSNRLAMSESFISTLIASSASSITSLTGTSGWVVSRVTRERWPISLLSSSITYSASVASGSSPFIRK
ncbi:Uncharacterised protein [Vibrio cholerae]|nr:Uncharacterised protein [Vibrio cholerae]